MPNDALQDAIKEAYAVAPAGKAIYDTLEIRQTGVQDTIYLVNTRIGIRATDEDGIQHDFEPAGFAFTLPAATEDGFRSLNIAIDNTDKRVGLFIKTALTETVPVEVLYRPYLSDDLSAPQMVPPLLLFLKDLQINSTQVTGRATFMDLVNKKFPFELYNRARFPALG